MDDTDLGVVGVALVLSGVGGSAICAGMGKITEMTDY